MCSKRNPRHVDHWENPNSYSSNNDYGGKFDLLPSKKNWKVLYFGICLASIFMLVSGLVNSGKRS